jgi:putative oxidoreductase
MSTNGQLGKIGFIAGRCIAGGMYLGAGAMNLVDLQAKSGYAASKGVSNPTLWVILASLLIMLGGASILTGIRPRLGVAAIALFLVPVTLIMHNFWMLSGLQADIEQHAFMGNVGLLGSTLVFLVIPQPWAVSLDAWVLSRVAMVRGMRAGAAVGQPAAAES